MKILIKRGGAEMAVKISVRENRKVQSCTNRQYRATGNTGKTKHWKNLHRERWANKTRDEDEKERIKRRYQI